MDKIYVSEITRLLTEAGFHDHRMPDPTDKHRFKRRAGFQCFQDGDRVLVYYRTRLGRYDNAVRRFRKYQQVINRAGFHTELVPQMLIVTR